MLSWRRKENPLNEERGPRLLLIELCWANQWEKREYLCVGSLGVVCVCVCEYACVHMCVCMHVCARTCVCVCVCAGTQWNAIFRTWQGHCTHKLRATFHKVFSKVWIPAFEPDESQVFVLLRQALDWVISPTAECLFFWSINHKLLDQPFITRTIVPVP